MRFGVPALKTEDPPIEGAYLPGNYLVVATWGNTHVGTK